MNQEEMQKNIADFERNRQQLMIVSSQKQQLEMQNKIIENALDELKKTKEKKVYKAIGNILLLSDVKDVEKELKDQKETGELKTKTLQKQEDALIEKLNKLKADIEFASGQTVSEKPKEEAN